MERLPQSSRLTWLAVAFGAGSCALLATVGADARWLAALGEEIVEKGSIPSGIPYAAAPSMDWVNVPVLGELTFHALQVIGGDKGLLLAQLVVATAALILLALGMRALGASDAASAAVLMVVFFAAAPSFIIVRAQLFSLVLFCGALLLLRAEARSPSWRIWLLVPLTALWANLHGAVLVGLSVAGAYLVFERFRREPIVAAGVLTSSTLALFLTPAWGDSGDYYLGVLRSEAALRGEGMWAPLSSHAPFDVLFVALAVPLVMFALRFGLQLWELACLAAFATFTIHAGRNSVWLICIVAAPAARGLSERFLPEFVPRRRAMLLCSWVPAALLIAGVLQPAPAGGASDLIRDRAAALAAGSPILADGLDAERLALEGHRVWIANPLDAFDLRDQRLYLDWLDAAPAGDRLLREGPVILVARGSPPDRRLARESSFRYAGGDSHAVIYVRKVLYAERQADVRRAVVFSATRSVLRGS
ncbi:MAG: hypothetical protein E6G03_11860 [Actinobacteria bacterium]|nr:MAG: hypothetical protein E6G03_11860 [Actinomycetota bacterium]